MAAKLSQSLKQTQSLAMTPQLQQAIKLLTLTHLEMTNVIAEEMVENPMLEEIDNSGVTESPEATEAKAENFNEEPIMQSKGEVKDDFDWNSYIESYNSTSSSQPTNMATRDSEDMPNYENIVTRGQTLSEHLEWQLRMEDLTEEELDFCLELIYSLADDGYLTVPLDEIYQSTKLDREDAENLVDVVRRLDPVGCACETLSECLLSQARIAEERSPILEKLIVDHLPDLKNRDHDKIAKKIGVTTEQVKDAAERLKSFHPKPGRLVSSGDTHYVVPDIYVVQVGEEFTVQINDDGVPRLRISKQYQDLLKSAQALGEKNEASEYVEERLKSAMWLIKSIQNRRRTIYRVAEAILRQQQMFFKKGPRFLKPMILKDIADEIGMHESTISRVTTNKYMHTPIGLFELKYFFNASIGNKNGGIDVSSEQLKIKIKDLIAAESPMKPLSDQKIADLLSKDDVKVARRTVAKYREMLGILTSSKRKVKK